MQLVKLTLATFFLSSIAHAEIKVVRQHSQMTAAERAANLADSERRKKMRRGRCYFNNPPQVSDKEISALEGKAIEFALLHLVSNSGEYLVGVDNGLKNPSRELLAALRTNYPKATIKSFSDISSVTKSDPSAFCRYNLVGVDNICWKDDTHIRLRAAIKIGTPLCLVNFENELKPYQKTKMLDLELSKEDWKIQTSPEFVEPYIATKTGCMNIEAIKSKGINASDFGPELVLAAIGKAQENARNISQSIKKSEIVFTAEKISKETASLLEKEAPKQMPNLKIEWNPHHRFLRNIPIISIGANPPCWIDSTHATVEIDSEMGVAGIYQFRLGASKWYRFDSTKWYFEKFSPPPPNLGPIIDY